MPHCHFKFHSNGNAIPLNTALTFTIGRPTSITVEPILAIYVRLMEAFELRLTVGMFTHNKVLLLVPSEPF